MFSVIVFYLVRNSFFFPPTLEYGSPTKIIKVKVMILLPEPYMNIYII